MEAVSRAPQTSERDKSTLMDYTLRLYMVDKYNLVLSSKQYTLETF